MGHIYDFLLDLSIPAIAYSVYIPGIRPLGFEGPVPMHSSHPPRAGPAGHGARLGELASLRGRGFGQPWRAGGCGGAGGGRDRGAQVRQRSPASRERGFGDGQARVAGGEGAVVTTKTRNITNRSVICM